MNRTSHYKSVLLFGDTLLVVVAAALASWIRGHQQPDEIPSLIHGMLLASFAYTTSFYIFDLYSLERIQSAKGTLLRSGLAAVAATIVLGFVFFALPAQWYGRGTLILQIPIVVVATTIWRRLLVKTLSLNVTKTETVIVGSSDYGRAIQQLAARPHSQFRVVAFVDNVEGSCEEDAPEWAVVGAAHRAHARRPARRAGSHPSAAPLTIGSVAVAERTDPEDDETPAPPSVTLTEAVKMVGVKTAILALPLDPPARLLRSIVQAKFLGITILDGTAIYERLSGRVPIKHIGPQWLLYADGFDLISQGFVQRTKRLVDVMIALGLLAATAPVWAIVALAVIVETSGPAFFRQLRVGRGGRLFSVWKFRSMRVGAEHHGGAQWATEDDPRVTRVGRLIRKLRIDELPQLLNVIRGEMSLIGPRPERPEFVSALENEIPYYGLRHSVLPGITGWAQVNYPYGSSIHDAEQKLEYDLFYIKNMSLFLDIRIALRTVGVVLFGSGAR